SKAAVIAAKECCDLPVFLTTAYDERGKLLTGSDPKTVVSVLEGLGVDALGLNCSFGPDRMLGVVKELTEYSSLPVIVKPNAGLPVIENGKTVYDVGPAEFAASMAEIAALGARLMGGCCGTTPEYIAQLKKTLEKLSPLPVTEKKRTLISSYSMALEFEDRPVLIGERINPTGKKAFKEALRNNDTDYILREALRQQDAGCDVLDVNVGLPEIDEVETLAATVSEIQAVTNLPLQIDTADAKAMEKALRIYTGKPMINSVNGKEEVMAQIFPLAKKYGGLIVALTLDESGIPETAEGRMRIAEKIYSRAAEYGIKKKDIIIDPLAMSISADKSSAETTLECVRRLSEAGCLSSLGVSNVSFGLPNRDYINAAFFTMAMQSGLSAGIVNPLSAEMMKAYYSYCALAGKDENFEKYIKYSSEFITETVKAAEGVKPAAAEESSGDALTDAIIKGLKDSSAKYTKELLEAGAKPIDIIDSKLIPALDTVGKGFENKTVFLPQLLMSAEAAAASFDIIKGYI
ncbi:MAG: dihydropteroate synthase, partial [Firmicutes bacterium]|nr:dihydropteroate synthase [Bacillota bacterium]